MATIRKPKLKRFPKAPKSSNPEALQRHLDRVKEIKKENTERMKPYLAAMEKQQKLKESIRKEKGSKTNIKGI